MSAKMNIKNELDSEPKIIGIGKLFLLVAQKLLFQEAGQTTTAEKAGCGLAARSRTQ
jgi:hypothetical protein